jgi:hypothetical protein
MSVPNDMTIERWRAEQKPCASGWEPGRFPCTGFEDDGAFGWTKGSFGIFEGNAATEIGYLLLSSLTHLKSGRRIALFADPATAALAGELAERVGDWSEIDENGITDEWKARAKQMYQLWSSAGLVYGPLTCDHHGVWCAPAPFGDSQLNS